MENSWLYMRWESQDKSIQIMYRRNVASDAHATAAERHKLFNTTLDICEERAQSKHSTDWANLSTWGGFKDKDRGCW